MSVISYERGSRAVSISTDLANIAALTLTAVAVVGDETTYTGTITGGGSDAFAGLSFVIAGFADDGNNVTILVTASTTTTLVCVTSTQADETHAGTATVQSSTAPYTDVEIGLEAYLQQSVLPRRIAWSVLIGSVANLNSMEILLEGSLDGSTWFTLDTYTTLADALRWVVDKPVRYLRGKVNAFDLAASTATTMEIAISL